MPSKSKTKGSGFEREVATFLSELNSESFVRVPNSGAYIGGSNSFRKKALSENQIKGFKGDIIPPDSWGNFNVECKNYADFPFHLLLTGECKIIDGWLEQLMAVAEPDDLNILILKVTRKGRYICVPSKYTWVTDNFSYYTSKNHKDWLILDFDSFFRFNHQLVKTYSTTPDTKSTLLIDTSSKSTEAI
jgi:hypothetical protein